MEETQAIKFLRAIQKEAWKRFGGYKETVELQDDFTHFSQKEPLNTVYDDNFREEARIKKQKLLEKYPLPSRFQDQSDYFILMGLHDRLKDAADKGLINIPNNVALGTMPYGASNGYTGTLDDGSHVVILQRGLFYFVNLTTKIILQLLPLEEVNGRLAYSSGLVGLPADIGKDSELRLRFFDLFESYIIHGDPLRAIPYLERTKFDSFFEFLLTGAELFALAHEYAHILLGHTDLERNIDVHTIGNPKDIALREYEADLLGAKITISSLNQFGLGAYWTNFAIFVYFWSCDIAEEGIIALQLGDDVYGVSDTNLTKPTNAKTVDPKATQILKDIQWRQARLKGESRLGNYPSPMNRLLKLQEALENDEVIKSQLDKASWFPMHIMTVSNGLELLSSDLVKYFRDLHKQGVRSSEKILPRSLKNTGTVNEIKYKTSWQKCVSGLFASKGAARKFYLRYVGYLTPFCFETYLGLLSDDQKWRDDCINFLSLVQPLYTNYLSRLYERLEEEKQRGTLFNYITKISSLLAISIEEYVQENSD